MIDFVGMLGIPPFLRIAKRVVMSSMHFRIAQICLFLETFFFCIQVVAVNNLALIRNCSGGAR